MKYKVPYSKMREGKRVIIYGAGNVGKVFWEELINSKTFTVVGWVDKNSDKIRCDNVQVRNISWLLEQECDYVLVAICNRNMAYSAMLALKKMGIDEQKLIWEDYRTSSHGHCDLEETRELAVLKQIEERLPKVQEIQPYVREEKNYENVIWTCWLQGFESAPEIVKKCNLQLKQMAGKHTVIEITKENVKEYIEIPEYIWAKHEKGIIGNTHLSDVIRVMLLAKYGGLWVDATCWFSDVVPEYYFKYPFFAFQTPMYFYTGIRLASNWLLGSTPNNELILWLEKYMLEWWRENDDVVDYFLMHYLMFLAVYQNLETFEIWNQLDYYDNITPHVLQHDFKRTFDKERYEYICKLTPVHKLTYKFEEVYENSFLAKWLEYN